MTYTQTSCAERWNCRNALSEPGTEPFGAVVAMDGRIVGEGLNHSLAHFDPTSHGEVEAIRDACRKLECVDSHGHRHVHCQPSEERRRCQPHDTYKGDQRCSGGQSV